MASERKLTQRGKERRRQIIDFAIRAFAENGYHPTSVADIVDGLGVGKGVFYWYFDSKEQLFCEILRESQTDLRRCQLREIKTVDGPVNKIAEGIRVAVTWSSENSDLARLFDFAQTDDRFAPLVRRGRKVLVDDAVPYLKEAIALGEIPDRDPVHLAYGILGVSTMLTSALVHERGEVNADVVDTAVSFCLGGIGAT